MCKFPFRPLTVLEMEKVKLEVEILDLRNKNKNNEVKSQRDIVPAFFNDLLDFSWIK